MKDCDLLDNPSSSNSNSNLIGDNKKLLHNYDSKHITLNQMLLNEKKFTSSQLNIVFSKFSSEFPHQTNECKNKFNKKIECASNISNCRISFKDYLKVLICISNKIFNSALNSLGSGVSNVISNSINNNKSQHKSRITNYYTNSSKLNSRNAKNSNHTNKTYDFNTSIERMLEVDTEEIQSYLENFIHLYIAPIYKHVVNHLDKEIKDLKILKKIFSESEKIEYFLLSMKPVLFKLFSLYSDDNFYLLYDDFMRYFFSYQINSFYLIIDSSRITKFFPIY